MALDQPAVVRRQIEGMALADYIALHPFLEMLPPR
jgi:hypothetical protein